MKREKWIKRSFLLVLCVLLAVVPFVGIRAEAAVKAKKVTLNRKSETMLAGKKVTLKVVSVSPSKASKKVVWRSSNPKIASVDQKGRVTAKKAGKATITAVSKSNKKAKGVCRITVYKKGSPASRIKLNQEKLSLVRGKAKRLKVARVRPIGASSHVKWSSSNPKVATVSKTGRVVGKKAGTTVIKAVSTGKKKASAKCKVTVYEKTVKLVNNGLKTYNKKIGDTFQVSAEVTIPSRNAEPVSWVSENPKVASVTEKGKVICKASGSCILKAVSGGKSLKVTLNVTARTAADGQVLSRGEWIKLLLAKTNKTVPSASGITAHYYADTRGSLYEAEIETAQVLGFLPPADSEGFEDAEQDIPFFRPDEKATREFAAYTAVHALGFENGTDRLKCSDAASLKYPAEDATAVRMGMLSLKQNAFLPGEGFTYSEKDVLFEAISLAENYKTVNTGKQSQSVSFEKGVLKESLENAKKYTLQGSRDGSYTVLVPKTKGTKEIKKGSVFVLPPNKEHPSGVALKAVSVKTRGGRYQIVCKKPEIQEVLSEVSFAGKVKMDPHQFIPSEGVSYIYEPSAGLSTGEYGGSIAVPGTLKFTVNKSIGSKAKAEGSISVSIPDITCKLKTGSGFKIKELTLSTTQKVSVQGKINYHAAGTEYKIKGGSGNEYTSTRIELGRSPGLKLGTTGLSLELVFFYTAGIDGSASIEYTAQLTEGFQYINSNFRTLNKFENSLDGLKLCGQAKVGIGISLVLDAFELMDLVGVDAQGGIQAKAEYVRHDIYENVVLNPPLHCGNASLSGYLTLELDPETAFGKLLKTVYHTSWSWNLITEKNSPFKLQAHLENGKIVEECTLGKGSISGKVMDAENSQALEKARVKLYSGEDEIRNTYTDADGKYSLNDLSAGEYTLKISATGYFTYEDHLTVRKNETTYADSSLMIDRKSEAGEVSGGIVDALTGDSLTGVSYEVRKGWNSTLGELVTTGTANGSYTVKLPAGNYTIRFAKTDYIANSINVAVKGGQKTVVPASLTPKNVEIGGDLRIVLSWGSTPRDLDSHLLGTSSDGEDFHTYFGSRTYREDGQTVAGLDLDDVSGYGPETTTVYQINPNGTYSYFVHDYTNRYKLDSNGLGNSGAKVKVYSGGVMVASYSVPNGSNGTLWHVFDYDPATKTIRGVNTMSYLNSPGSLARGTEQENVLKAILWEDIQKRPKKR